MNSYEFVRYTYDFAKLVARVPVTNTRSDTACSSCEVSRIPNMSNGDWVYYYSKVASFVLNAVYHVVTAALVFKL